MLSFFGLLRWLDPERFLLVLTLYLRLLEPLLELPDLPPELLLSLVTTAAFTLRLLVWAPPVSSLVLGLEGLVKM